MSVFLQTLSIDLNLFSRSFFSTQYVKAYLSHWNNKILLDKITNYENLTVPTSLYLSHEIQLNELLISKGLAAKAEYKSQIAFSDLRTPQTNIEFYYSLSNQQKGQISELN